MTSATSGANTTRQPVRLPRSTRRKQLLAAAQRVFVARGYHATAMDDIAECAGVSKPVLYQHFPGKLDLYLALLDTHCDALAAKVHLAMGVTTENEERINGAIRAYFEFVDHEGEAFRLVFESDLRNEGAVRQRVERMERECVSCVTHAIVADTGVTPDAAEFLASGLVGAASSAARFWLARGRPIPLAEAARLVATLAWRGIGTFPLQGQTE